MTETIKPSVGRIVHFHPTPDSGMDRNGLEPLAAIVTCVWSDRCVNLAVFDASSNYHAKTSVDLVQPGDGSPEAGLEFCTWMPYQVKKATGSESGEAAAGTESI